MKSVLNRDQTMWSGTAVSLRMLTTVDVTGPGPWGAPSTVTSCSSWIIAGSGGAGVVVPREGGGRVTPEAVTEQSGPC